MASEQLAIPGAQEFERRSLTPAQLLSVALQNNAAIDVIERLAALQEKWMAREAEVEFNEAMNRVQAKVKRVLPDLDNSQTGSRYASYAAIDREVRPIYSAEGFSLSFGTDDCPLAEHIRVICYVSRWPHTRRYQVDMPCDGKGAKGGDVMTKTHASGAAMSYGMRYLLKYIFNISIGEDDADGNSAEAIGKIIGEILACQTVPALDSAFRERYQQAKGKTRLQKLIVEAKDKRKRELNTSAPVATSSTVSGMPLNWGKK